MYHTVVDRFPMTPQLDPASAALFAAAFVAALLLTLRRPAYGAAILAFAPPFDVAHAVLGTTITFPKLLIIAVAAGLSGRRDVWRMLKSAPARTQGAAFLAVAAATALTLVAAHHRLPAIREALKWTEYAALFAVAAVAYAADPDAGLVRRAFHLSVIAVCASALLDELLGAPFGIWINNFAVPRISGFLEGPNQLAGYLEVALAACAAWQVRERSRLGSIALFAAALALPLTFSRGAFIGVAVVVAVVAAVDRHAMRALVPLGAGLAAGFAGVAGWIALAHASIAADFFRASDTSPAAAAGLGTRSQLWHAALFFFRHHPLLGIGAGNYELDLADAGVNGVRTHANSWYLQALAEGGIVLFGATIAFIVTTLATLRTRLRTSPWALAAFAATLALALHQTIDYLVFYPKVAEPWIVLIALGIAAPRAD